MCIVLKSECGGTVQLGWYYRTFSRYFGLWRLLATTVSPLTRAKETKTKTIGTKNRPKETHKAVSGWHITSIFKKGEKIVDVSPICGENGEPNSFIGPFFSYFSCCFKFSVIKRSLKVTVVALTAVCHPQHVCCNNNKVVF